MSSSPGGVGDGLPSLPTGEPVLARWFAIAMLILVPVGIGMSIWAFLSTDREVLTAAERRPVGTAEVTHERGQAALNEILSADPGPSCASEIDVVGDQGAIDAGKRALGAACQLISRGVVDDVAAEGLAVWVRNEGVLRFAVFEVTGLDSSARIEDGRPVIELNAKFQFEDATRAAPAILHELVHLAGEWPGQPVGDADELRAVEVQAQACDNLVFADEPPRGCLDAEELLADPDPLSQLGDAGYRPVR